MTDQTVSRDQALLNTAIAQRDAAMNHIVELTADLVVASGRIAALEARIAELEKTPTE